MRGQVELADLTPALAASLRHAASMHNPQFYEKQRMRASTWDIPRFLQFFDETVDGGLTGAARHAHDRDRARRAGSWTWPMSAQPAPRRHSPARLC